MVNSLHLSICYAIRVAEFEAMNNRSRFTCEAKLSIDKHDQYNLNPNFSMRV